MHRGYTKRWRKRWDKGTHKDPLLWVMMDYFIDFANWKDTEVPFIRGGKLIELIELKRGQHLFTISGVAEFLDVSRDKIRARLQKLAGGMQFLHIKTHRLFSIATILNYERYQSQDDCNPHEYPQLTHRRPTGDPQVTHTPNKDKKDKKVKKDKIPPYNPPTGDQLKSNGENWIDVESWDEFLQHRKDIKKPLTQLAVTKALKLLRDNQPDQKKIIDNTITNRWTGLFELKNKSKSDDWEKLKQWAKEEDAKDAKNRAL